MHKEFLCKTIKFLYIFEVRKSNVTQQSFYLHVLWFILLDIFYYRKIFGKYDIEKTNDKHDKKFKTFKDEKCHQISIK